VLRLADNQILTLNQTAWILASRHVLEANIARLLKQVKTDLPPEPSTVARKASNAAKVRWRGSGPA